MNKKITSLIISGTLALTLIPAGTVSANNVSQSSVVYPLMQPYGDVEKQSIMFSDIKDEQLKNSLSFLVERQVVTGYGDGLFRPTQALTEAEAMSFLTKAFNLEVLDATKLISTSKWYNELYAAAIQNGVSVADEANFKEVVTKQQFAGWIIDQLDRIGVYPVNRMYIHIADREDIAEELSNKVQNLLLTQIASLGEDQLFNPKQAITREEAANWISKAIEFADNMKAKQEEEWKVDKFGFEQGEKLNQAKAIKLLKQVLKLEDSYVVDDSIKADELMTKEKFASVLVSEFDKVAPYPVVTMYIRINDQDQITEDYSYKVHTLLLTGIAELEENASFRPKDAITAEEAIEWMRNAAVFYERLQQTALELKAMKA